MKQNQPIPARTPPRGKPLGIKIHQETVAPSEIDPVCGMQVAPNTTRRFTWQERNFYFCCDGCLQKFSADPQKYLQQGPDASCCGDALAVAAPDSPAAALKTESCCSPAPAAVKAESCCSPAPAVVKAESCCSPAPAAAKAESCCSPAPAPKASSCCAGAHPEAAASGLRDPVCGMKVEADAPWHTRHQGQEYFFCAEVCLHKFEADPAHYLSGAHKQQAQDPDAMYYCPMCEGMEQIGPGDCAKCGMALEPMQPSSDDSALRDMQSRTLWAAAFTLPLMLLAMSDLWPALHHSLRQSLGAGFGWLQALLTLPVALWAGAPLQQRAWRSWRSMQLNMFSLIGLGVWAALGFSLFALLAPQAIPAAFMQHGMVPLYFEAAATIITLVLLGQTLEMRAHKKTQHALHSLMQAAPAQAIRVRADGVEEEVPLAQLKSGDQLRVKPGARLAADGVIMQGAGLLDESMLTGEAIPLAREQGGKVLAGSINLQGSFLMQVQHSGAQTVLAGIIALVNQASRSRLPVQQLVDKIAACFVPVVVATAILSAVLWLLFGPAPAYAHALLSAISVLIIACPCALGLATPVAVTVGIGRAARAGILLKQAASLDTLLRADTLVLDKTGTLTEGRPSLRQRWQDADEDSAQMLQIAASLEGWSEHPLAHALLQAMREQGLQNLPVSAFQHYPGMGIGGHCNGRDWLLGNAALLQQHGVQAALPPQCAAWQDEGCSLILLAAEGRVRAVFGLADALKANAKASLDALRAQGLRIVLASGDQPHHAQRVAQQLGIDEAHGGMLPQDKLALIEKLQQQGHCVAMAGDGVNDAPALARADLGIALGMPLGSGAQGNALALHSAQMVLMRGDLHGLLQARALAAAMRENIRQNLAFAFGYNLLGVLLAAGLLYPFTGWLLSPMLASAAMSASSLSVLMNALRLSRLKL
ncbi:heavy metal translocating P-type ATPase [Massilia sp. W12]|uniref:heavy metal translocating P-type ATPase n=1 Tax=Massilia sp. W12 TaxID=3126507 RepID=UPI0030D3B804